MSTTTAAAGRATTVGDGRTRTVVEEVLCDLCGRPTQEPTVVVLGLNRSQRELDLCPADYEEVGRIFDRWIAGRLKVSRRGSRAAPNATSTAVIRGER